MNTEMAAHSSARRDPEAVALGQRIKWARGQIIRRDMAAKLGVHENTVGKWEVGETVPTVLQLMRIAEVSGRPVTDLLGLDVDAPVTSSKSGAGDLGLSTHAVQSGSILYVPLVDVKGGPDEGSVANADSVKGMHCFPVSQVRVDLGIAHNDIVVVQAVGSSGGPDIRAGDLVLVDLKDTEVITEGLHLIRIDGVALIKYLHRRPGQLVVSERRGDPNGTFMVGLAELVERGSGYFEVLGRCRWAGINLH